MNWRNVIVVLASYCLGAATAASLRALFSVPCGHVQRRKSPQKVATLHPKWLEAPGTPQPHPFSSDEFAELDPETLDKPSIYAFFISAVVPRPVAFVSTLSQDGQPNLAPYSYFNGLSHDPPVVAIGVCRSGVRGGGKKDTFQNIEDTKQFVVNIISEWFIEAANHTCGEFERGVSEWNLSGLTPIPSKKVKPARVKESAVQLECIVRHVYELTDKSGKPTAAIIIGEVVLFHAHEQVTGRSPTGKLVVDFEKLRPISRLGGVSYGRTTEYFDLPRPDKLGHYKAPA